MILALTLIASAVVQTARPPLPDFASMPSCYEVTGSWAGAEMPKVNLVVRQLLSLPIPAQRAELLVYVDSCERYWAHPPDHGHPNYWDCGKLDFIAVAKGAGVGLLSWYQMSFFLRAEDGRGVRLASASEYVPPFLPETETWQFSKARTLVKNGFYDLRPNLGPVAAPDQATLASAGDPTPLTAHLVKLLRDAGERYFGVRSDRRSGAPAAIADLLDVARCRDLALIKEAAAQFGRVCASDLDLYGELSFLKPLLTNTTRFGDGRFAPYKLIGGRLVFPVRTLFSGPYDALERIEKLPDNAERLDLRGIELWR